jgi:hypothetical protein
MRLGYHTHFPEEETQVCFTLAVYAISICAGIVWLKDAWPSVGGLSMSTGLPYSLAV